jgi:hypothetical protein
MNKLIGYRYLDEYYCPDHIIAELPTGEGEAFDGWALAAGFPPLTAEENLDEIALAFTIDRDEDYDEFPQRIYEDDVEERKYCFSCGSDLLTLAGVVT